MDKKFVSEFLRGSAAATIGSVASMAFHFVSIMLLTRYLSKEDFGLYILIVLTAYLFNIFGGLGLEITLTKFISSDTEQNKPSIFATTIIARAVPLILVLIIFSFVSELVIEAIDKRILEYIALIPILIIIVNYRDLFNNLMQGLKLFKHLASTQIISALIRVSLILAAVVTGELTLTNLVYIEIISVLVALVMQFIVIPFKPLLPFKPSYKIFKKLIAFSFPLYLNNLLTFAYDRINLLIIGIYLTAESVANYDVADKIPDALKKLFYSFIVVYFPHSANLFAEKKLEDARKLMNKSLITISIILSFGVMLAFILRNEIVGIIFSEAYIGASFAFALLMLNFYLRAISNILGYSLVSAGFSTTSIKTNSVASVVSIGGSLLLIPIYGYIGAVYSLLAMNIVSQIIYLGF
ncbi:MAG: oligosaccharide flippase family protein, partial [Nitrososphaeraceae archaeon]|nr:oligosaccharide flippase family protein [Nitrososphaeraceae archaeon]